MELIFNIFTPIGLLIQALVAAVFGRIFGAGWGAISYLISFVVFLAVGWIFIPSISEHGLTWIFIVIMGGPFIFSAGALGLAAGVFLRKERKIIALSLFVPLFAYWMGITTIEAKKNRETALVVEFVKTNREIIQAVGEHADANVSSHTKSYGTMFPSRYEIWVRGEKGLDVVVDVSRSWGIPTFSIACINPIPIGSRDPRKDACKQLRNTHEMPNTSFKADVPDGPPH